MIIKPFFYLSIIRISIRLSQRINICSWNVCHYKVVFQCCLFVVYFDIRVSQIPLLNFFLKCYSKRIDKSQEPIKSMTMNNQIYLISICENLGILQINWKALESTFSPILILDITKELK